MGKEEIKPNNYVDVVTMVSETLLFYLTTNYGYLHSEFIASNDNLKKAFYKATDRCYNHKIIAAAIGPKMHFAMEKAMDEIIRILAEFQKFHILFDNMKNKEKKEKK